MCANLYACPEVLGAEVRMQKSSKAATDSVATFELYISRF